MYALIAEQNVALYIYIYIWVKRSKDALRVEMYTQGKCENNSNKGQKVQVFAWTIPKCPSVCPVRTKEWKK